MTLAQVLAGLRANTPDIEYVVTQNQPSNQELEARSQVSKLLGESENLLTNAELIAHILEALGGDEGLNVEGRADGDNPLARFRRCKEHGALYVPSNQAIATFGEAASETPKNLSPTEAVIRKVCRCYPDVLHFMRDGNMLTDADGTMEAEGETRWLRGNVMGFRGPRSIQQNVEAAYDVTVEFFLFVMIGSRWMPRKRITRETIETWFEVPPNILSAHRSPSMNGGLVTDYAIEEIEEWSGNPQFYRNWEREAIAKGWSG